MSQEFVARNGIISKSNLIVSGSLTALSTITAQTLVVQTITSSISSITGSTNFGSLSVNTHTFTGSVLISGSVSSTSAATFTGTLTGTTADFETTIGTRYLQIRDAGTSTPSIRSVNNTIAQLRHIAIEANTISLRTGASSGLTVTEALAISATGAATFSGQIKTTFAGQSIAIDGGSTASVRMQLQNTSGNAGVTVESSTGGDQFSGTSAYSMAIGTYTEKNFHIGTNSVTRMTITSAGNVGIGTASPTGKLEVKGDGGGAGKTFRTTDSAGNETFVVQDGGLAYLKYGPLLINTTTNNGDSLQVKGAMSAGFVGGSDTGFAITSYFSSGTSNSYLGLGTSYGVASGGDVVLTLNTSGKLIYVRNISAGVYLSGGATSWTANSDETIKDIIEPITNGLDKIKDLRTVIYKLKNDETNQRKIGLIAQDVEKVLPEAITKSYQKEYDREILGLNYTDLIPVLVKAIQELTARVQYLENK